LRVSARYPSVAERVMLAAAKVSATNPSREARSSLLGAG
jgi:hypothetical protein